MTGIELVAFLGSCFALVACAATGAVHIHERRKGAFLRRLRHALGSADALDALEDVQSGDVEHPLSFTYRGVRVRALVRGRAEVWQLERIDDTLRPTALADTLAVVQRGWHAPDVRRLAEVGGLTPRLCVYAEDTRGARRLLERVRGDLCTVLGRRTRRCVVAPGRVFLELSRHGFAVEELKDALCRLDALLAVLLGEEFPVLPELTETSLCAVAGPGGALIPALEREPVR